MYSLAALGFSSFVLSLLLTPLVRNLAWRWGPIDQPDGNRRVHSSPVPRMGGLAIALACLGAFGLVAALPAESGGIGAGAALPLPITLLPAMGAVFLTGLLDDLWGLRPRQKLFGQCVAALLAVWAGLTVTAVGGFVLPIWVVVPLTILWLVGCANAFNLIDGLDGLSAGLGLFATLTMLLASLIQGNLPLAMATTPLAGALLGFLRYNFNPATIFLGDCGSLLIGFLLGCLGVIWSQKSTTVLGMTAPLIALAIPLLDTALAIVRRLLAGRPIFEGDRQHVHHRLLARGLTPRKVVLLLYAAAGIGAVLSIAQTTMDNRFDGVAVVVFCVAAWIGVQHLGYAEFGVARKMVVEGAFHRQLRSALALRSFEDTLAGAATNEQRWRAVLDACREFGFSHAEMKLNGSVFSKTLEEINGSPTWDIQIPLSNGGYLHLKRCFGETGAPAAVAPFADVLRRNLGGDDAGEDAAPPRQGNREDGQRSAAVGA